MLFRELSGDTLVSVKQYYRLAVKTGSIALQKKKILRSHYLLCCFLCRNCYNRKTCTKFTKDNMLEEVHTLWVRLNGDKGSGIEKGGNKKQK